MNQVAVCAHASMSRIWFAALFPAICLWVAAAPVWAQSPIVRIEEDWELILLTPDIDSVGPQIVCTFSPVGNLDGLYATFELNHGSFPEFTRGGLNLQVWNGESHVSTQTFPNASIMSTAGETVRWTQCIEVQNGQAILEILNGHSATWGDFGNQGNLKAVLATNLTDLNGYSPDVSSHNSGVTFASNRVASLTLKTVRMIRADGTVQSVTVNQVVEQTTP